MVVIIAGPRDFHDTVTLTKAMKEVAWTAEEVVSGCASGVDRMAEEWAESWAIPVRRFPAKWDEHGDAAGPIRNREMAAYAASKGGRLLALWDGVSKGTRSMIDEARKLKVPTMIYYISKD
jgi:hypothetical protein